MDVILNGILTSDHSDGLKKQLLQKIAEKGAQPQAIKSIKAVFELMVDWYLDKDSELAATEGLFILKTWAKHNHSTFEQFFDREYLINLLSRKCRREYNVPILVKECLHLLQRSGLFYSHLKVIEAMAINYVLEHPSMKCIVNFINLLKTYREGIPKGDFLSKFCITVINGVSLTSRPDGNVMEYFHGSELIFKFISFLWNKDQLLILESLKAIFTLLADPAVELTFCLGAVIQYIPKEMFDLVVKYAVFESKIDDESMTKALGRIIDWIQWPTAEDVSILVIGFLRSLAVEKRFSVLISVTESKIEQVFVVVNLSQVREGALNVLSQMLLSFQHSPEPFHKILPLVPKVMSTMRSESTANSQHCAVRLSNLIHCCMYHHAGYPDLYDPVLEVIKDFPPPDAKEIQTKLAENKWTNQKAGTKNYIPKVTQRSETGKTGLHNLGNTCFMNSVVQALFMADRFRRCILASPSLADKTLTSKLQQLFAFLSHTQRPAYAPMNFLAASRPPWFTAGHQQDCSEFMKYMLDQIHEEEKTAVKKTKLSLTDGNSKGNVSMSNGENHDSKEPDSLIEESFGGELVTTYTCSKCRTESSRSELFTDIPLAFPEYGFCEKSLAGGNGKSKKVEPDSSNNVSDNGKSSNESKKLHLNDLVQFYLKPENLTGDNKYFCEKCGELQDAVRTIKLKQAPDNLIFTLLRFSYDAKRHTRTKIFRDVKYPRTLVLPFDRDVVDTTSPSNRRKSLRTAVTSQIGKCGITTNTTKGEVYSLYGVIVHSGVSSESGHYYCYARHSMFTNPESFCDKIKHCENEDDIDFLQNKWYLFNDSSVSHARFDSFSNVTQRFTKDTPYILFYKRINPEKAEGQEIDLNKSLHTSEVDPPIRADLRALVNKDNTFYLQEQEAAAKAKSSKKQETPSTSSWFKWDPDDDKGPPGSCGGSGFGGLDGANRFVF